MRFKSHLRTQNNKKDTQSSVLFVILLCAEKALHITSGYADERSSLGNDGENNWVLFSPKFSPQSKEYKKLTLVNVLDDYATGVGCVRTNYIDLSNKSHLRTQVRAIKKI